MKIRPLVKKDRKKLHALLLKTRFFTPEEVDVAMELIDIALKNRDQKDYRIHCLGDDRDDLIGYLCYGPTPMTQGTFDLYWIAVDPEFQGHGAGSKLMLFLEEQVKREKGRMILADTSSTGQYDKTQKFYVQNGYVEVARVPDYYHPGNDRITFCKKIV